jgi:DegV family protein with EDD domain
MRGKIRIVTDSSAQFLDPTVVHRYNITVVPLDIRFGTQTYREGVDINADSFFRKLNGIEPLPELVAPSVDRFAEVYARLNRETDQILSIHLSRAMHPTWQNAKSATQTLLGRCEIAVLDSQTTSIGLGLLVEAAAHCAEQESSLDEVVRQVRKSISHVYSVFYVETMDFLRRGGLVSESQAILGKMLGIKPFLTIEEGELITMEKVRTRQAAVDKLVEFVTELSDVDNLIILQNTPHATEQTRLLQERLSQEFPQKTSYPLVVYNPSLATFIGPDGMGIVVFERSVDADDTDEDDLDDHQADR